MRNYLILSVFLIVVSFGVANAQSENSGGYGRVLRKSGLAQSTINLQNGIGDQVKELMSQKDSEQTTSSKNSSKNYAVFKPSQSENMKIIAAELGENNEEKALYEQLFTETKKGFEAEVASKGMKNNIAAAMTFLMATTVMVYNEAPEPSDEATDKIFNSLNTMIDEMPEMASVPNKDKQFLYDAYISFGGLTLAFYSEAKDTKDKDLMNVARVMAGSLLLEFFKINPNKIRFEGNSLVVDPDQPTQTPQTTKTNTPKQPAGNYGITKYTTNFDDGWVATALNDYVQLQKNSTEIRLFYVNKEWDDSRLNTVEPTDHYWAKTVSPYFNVGNVQRWSGVEYPVIYFLQADAVDKKTNKQSFITMKIIYEGGARVIVTIAPNKETYQQQFAHPNDLNKMLNANRFAVTAQDLNGTWSGSGGGGVEYYNAYGYAGMSAISTSDEFVFAANSSYQSTHDSANMSGGGTRFAKVQYKGKFTASDWELFATNRVSGKTKKFLCQFEAVRGGFLLKLTDSDYEPLKYTLFKKR